MPACFRSFASFVPSFFKVPYLPLVFHVPYVHSFFSCALHSLIFLCTLCTFTFFACLRPLFFLPALHALRAQFLCANILFMYMVKKLTQIELLLTLQLGI